MDVQIELINLFPAAVLVVDRQGSVIGSNAAAQRMLGLPGEQLSGHPLDELAHDQAATLETFLKRAWRSSSWLPGALTIRNANGAELRCRVAGARVKTAPGQEALLLLRLEPNEDEGLTQFHTLNRKLDQLAAEVARRRRIEALLAGEKIILEGIAAGAPISGALDRLALLLESQSRGMRASILLLDAEDRLRHAAGPNLPAGYTQAIDGVRIGPQVGSCGTAAYRKQRVVVSDIQTDPLWEPYRELAAAHGLRACWSTPIVDEKRQVIGTLALYYDQPRSPTPSELSLVDNAAQVAAIAIARHNSIRERTRLLEEARRGQAQAEAANRAKDRFLAMLGHELRNPVGAILLAAQALAELGGRDAEIIKLTALVRRQGENLRRILDDLLDVARIDAGKLTLRPEALDLSALVTECVEIALPLARAGSQSLELRAEPVHVEGDPTRLEQIVRNLVDNAMKYTPEGGTIVVEVRQEGAQAVLCVRDDGLGMGAEDLARCFEPFAQAEQALERSSGGIGLGLPLVKRLVEMHAGQVHVRSEGLGRGTEVEVCLPALQNAVAPRAPQRAEPDQPPAAAARPVSVLVVEDNEDARLALTTLLSRWGHTIEVAADGQRGLELALSAEVEVALIDIGIPLLDGYQLAHAIRASTPPRPLRLVAMTGYGQPADRRRALEAGFDDHLVKPVSAQELRAALEPSP